MAMHVGIDARMIGHSGVGVYVGELVRHLPACDAGLRLTLFGDPARLTNLVGERCRVVPFRAPIYGVRERWGWPREAEECDVLHAPHHCAPARPPRPMAVTIHDLIHLLGPGALRGVKRWWARRLFDSAVRSAGAIITDSEATRRDLLATIPEAGPKSLEVIPLAAAAIFAEPRQEEKSSRRHWLAVGIDKPHKGYDFLLGVLREMGETAPLVVMGSEARVFESNHRVALRGLSASLEARGWVSEAEMAALYRDAIALLFPSRREGFGLPAVEAMAAECPVLAARAGSLPEVVGEGGMLLPPDDAAAWVAAMQRVESDRAHRTALIVGGRAWVERFSWSRTAAATLEVYRRIAEAG